MAITVNIGLIGVSGSLEDLIPGLTAHEYILLLIAIEVNLVMLFGCLNLPEKITQLAQRTLHCLRVALVEREA